MKRILVFISILALLTVGTACSATTATPSAGAPTPTGVLGTPADVSGEISDVVGNEVTIRLYDASEDVEAEVTRVPGSGKGKTEETVVRTFSGETLVLIIPVGTRIVTRVTSTTTDTTATGTGPVEEEIGLDDLVKGMTLKIYYLEDGKTIEKILAVPQR
jgi:hypothetical protein